MVSKSKHSNSGASAPTAPPILVEASYDAMELFARHLRRLRRANKLTQKQVADAVSMHVKHYQKIELEMWNDVRLSTVEKLARFYGLNAWRMIEAPLFREVPLETSAAPIQQQSSRSGKAKRH